MAKRFIRLTLTVLLLATGAVVVLLWVRSHQEADRLHGRLWGRTAFVVASKQGGLTVVGFVWHAAPNWWTWEARSYPVDDEMSFPVGDMKQYQNWLGFGMIRNPIYFVMRPKQTMPDGTSVVVMGAATTTLRGTGVIIPYWLILGLTVLRISKCFRNDHTH